MDTIPIEQLIQAVFGLARDMLVYLAPLIGLLAGLKFILDWIHKLLFGKKV